MFCLVFSLGPCKLSDAESPFKLQKLPPMFYYFLLQFMRFHSFEFVNVPNYKYAETGQNTRFVTDFLKSTRAKGIRVC